MQIDTGLRFADLQPLVERFAELAKGKVRRLEAAWNVEDGAPVFTRQGRYATKGWTDWTRGFQYGSQLLVFDLTDDEEFYELGRRNTLGHMARHVTHIGVHDHGFNILSTYGNLRRLLREERVIETRDALELYDLAIKASGAVQAARWTTLHDGTGFIHSFNGPHSLFSDTIRSCRSLVLAHQLGHVLAGENDRAIDLLGRALDHAANTARYNVYYGEGRDVYDVPGRVCHESLFNVTDGHYRCASTQQGYSPFSTWTRGLAWILLGYAEELEAMGALPDIDFESHGGRSEVAGWMRRAATVTAEYYIAQTARDGIPYWDDGAPGLARMPEWREAPSDPDNPYEPVDSSAAAIAAQGLLRLGHVLGGEAGRRYTQAGLTTARTLLSPPYLSEDAKHQGLVLHAVYHRPKNWDYLPAGSAVPRGESCMWGDYHGLELAVYLQRGYTEEDGEAGLRPYPAFFDQGDAL